MTLSSHRCLCTSIEKILVAKSNCYILNKILDTFILTLDDNSKYDILSVFMNVSVLVWLLYLLEMFSNWRWKWRREEQSQLRTKTEGGREERKQDTSEGRRSLLSQDAVSSYN